MAVLPFVLFVSFLPYLCKAYVSNPVNCFNCYISGPFEEKCTTAANCTGNACLLSFLKIESDVTKNAKCLTLERSIIEEGCWTDVQTGSKHCICVKDWCNTFDKEEWGAVLENNPFPPERNSSYTEAETFTMLPIIDQSPLRSDNLQYEEEVPQVAE
uniref:Uncharacterized protein n=1 Tax=Plectus sambesii TaxID=2011161 RepID=A0A914X6A8_9BILA